MPMTWRVVVLATDGLLRWIVDWLDAATASVLSPQVAVLLDGPRPARELRDQRWKRASPENGLELRQCEFGRLVDDFSDRVVNPVHGADLSAGRSRHRYAPSIESGTFCGDRVIVQ